MVQNAVLSPTIGYAFEANIVKSDETMRGSKGYVHYLPVRAWFLFKTSHYQGPFYVASD